jgi:hypothetical protein
VLKSQLKDQVLGLLPQRIQLELELPVLVELNQIHSLEWEAWEECHQVLEEWAVCQEWVAWVECQALAVPEVCQTQTKWAK